MSLLCAGNARALLTILRPSGKAEFENHVVDVVTEGEFIAPETPVTIARRTDAGRGQGSRRVIRASASQLTRTVFTYLTLLLITSADLSLRRS